jgi:probable dihydroxyacetone kinase regulator
MSQHTKAAMAESLKKMLSRTTLDKITVKDIADDCDVNRQTFYYHFKDIYDLVEWIVNNATVEALGDNSDTESCKKGYISILESLRENKALITNLYRSISRKTLEEYIGDIFYKYLLDIIIDHAEGMSVSYENITFIARFYKYSFTGLLLDWVKTGMTEDPVYLVEQSVTLFEESTKHRLKSLEGKTV